MNNTINNELVILVFVIIILIAMTRFGPVSALLLMSLVANAVLMYPSVTQTPATETFMVNENPVEYADERNKYISGYTLAYDKPRPIPGLGFGENTHNIDNANTMQWRERGTRDKKRSDGWATKDANYYRYHFADELNYEENKVWHGREDY